jgi:hypothetical protein
VVVAMSYPDYGTPGDPNMDPYFISPKREREIEEARLCDIDLAIEAYGEDVTGLLKELAESLAQYNATIVSITVDPVTLAVKVQVKS